MSFHGNFDFFEFLLDLTFLFTILRAMIDMATVRERANRERAHCERIRCERARRERAGCERAALESRMFIITKSSNFSLAVITNNAQPISLTHIYVYKHT